MEPTAEQQAAREAFAAGQDLALVAGAGTGKTSTLVLMGASTRRRGLYVAFNKAIAVDAARRFGPNVVCRTAHSLAFRTVGRAFQHRLDAPRIPAKQTAHILGLVRDLDLGGEKKITVSHQARLVMGMIRRYCYSTDQQVTARHMEPVNGLDGEAQAYLAHHLLRFAVKAWDDLRSRDGRLRFEHDHYMKLWALTEPSLGADFVLLDEAQDTNPVLEEVFLAQDAQRVCVGDPAQQIYGWRSARDVMTGFPAQHLHLTQSFRLGPDIAAVANRWLKHAESAMQLAGHGPADSRIESLTHPDAVLVRGNADAMAHVIGYLNLGVPVALTGGGTALERIAHAAQELKAGKRTSHPELFLFSSWAEVQEYVQLDTAGADLKATVDLVDTYGPDTILQAVQRLAPEYRAKVTVSTAHKAKGREWDTVRIGRGFDPPAGDGDGPGRELNPAEARLIYVAVSRARHRLDPDGVAWIDAYEQRRAGTQQPLGTLSLTGQLKHPASPVSQFMHTHLPASGNVEHDYLAHLTGLPHPVQPLDVRYPDWTALGHAIDYRLRLSFGGGLGVAVTLGVEALLDDDLFTAGPSQAVRAAVHDAGRDLLSRVKEHLLDPGRSSEDDLARLCFVASFYEDLCRTGRLRRYSMLANPAYATPATALDDLTAAVPAYAVDDIHQQTRLARQPLAALRALPAEKRICGPLFTGSTDLGGADADFILDGLLLDCKATTHPRRLGREEIYQLAGYLLLDYHDHHKINKVGLYLSRQGALITWSVPDFLHRLGATTGLPELRAALRTHLQTATG
ncbi:ATP-dependent helicase [Actinocorallia sp. API 0066]|uniref:UvrD-helicase domain-containing protein n=1 Tax=Actinocorallia sp. API 0066 TaxID=2896846 RepID=UPI001E3D2092|nr:ATP-dependent helicase [Actinocorallia sp. API 0066]MCD0451756.1 ATP-dependent helicase [Actinocorallia sp. API 0066]